MDYKKKASRLWILWWIAYGVFAAVLFACQLWQTFETGEFVFPTISSGYVIAVFVAVVLFFLPVMTRIHWLSRKANISASIVISAILMAIQIFWVFFMLVTAIVYVLNPSLIGPVL